MNFAEYLPADSSPESMIKRLRFGEHKPRYEHAGQLPCYLIDIVFGNKRQPGQLEQVLASKPPTGSASITLPKPPNPAQEPAAGDGQSIQPERIRLNSTLLLEALEEITGLYFTRSRVDDERVLLSQVILRPFKIFVTYQQEIRDEVARLKDLHAYHGEDGGPDWHETSQSSNEHHSKQPAKDSLPKDENPSSTNHLDGTATMSNQDDPRIISYSEAIEEENRFDSKRCLEEMRVLRDLLDHDLRPTFNLRQQIKDGITRNIAFQDLWHLFPLGTELIANDSNGENQVYRVLNVIGGKSFLSTRKAAGMDALNPTTQKDRGIPKFKILTHFYDYDGKDLGECQRLLTTKWYDGVKSITSLPYYPVNYAKVQGAAKPRDYFIQRGRRFIELIGGHNVVHKRYNGLTLAMDGFREEVDSGVIVDVGMAVLKNGISIDFGTHDQVDPDPRETLELLDHWCDVEGCCQNDPIHKDYIIDMKHNEQLLKDKGFIHDFIETNNEPSEDDYLVCPCWVYAYALRSRKWVKLEVDLIEDIKEWGRGFDALVLPDGHRETLLALVQIHSKGKQAEPAAQAQHRQLDLVRGKGKGLIILLHGEPGVGKSSTAECVAEFTHRPLFQITCGDIGESADEVERRLEDHFQLAHKWGCVLLLDEADVFLEARSKTDLKRNAIVSVFLRVLEYYSGILFLTTNRVGAFDQAFRSRIHMSLFYPKIDEDVTIQIWDMNIARTREIWGDKLSMEEEDCKQILSFASKHYRDLEKSNTTWNGRQIRNAFQTAIALAEWDAHKSQQRYKSPTPLKPRLEKEHFDEYLNQTLVGTVADLALENRERKDDFPA